MKYGSCQFVNFLPLYAKTGSIWSKSVCRLTFEKFNYAYPLIKTLVSSKARIFVDESGDPGVPNVEAKRPNLYFVFGYVYSRDPSELKKRLRRLLKTLHNRNKYPPKLEELKFHLPGRILTEKYGYAPQTLKDEYKIHMPEIRRKALSIINDFSDGVFAVIIDKRRIFSSWDDENLSNSVFTRTLLVNILNVIQAPTPPMVIYDKRGLSSVQTRHFHNYVRLQDDFLQQKKVKRYQGSITRLKNTSSTQEAGIWAADMVAGSFYHKYMDGDDEYSNMINSKRIGDGEQLFSEEVAPPW